MTRSRKFLAPVLLVLYTLCLAMMMTPLSAEATPLYSAREGRACDNCHLGPERWVNPPLTERKCTMSCQACHVDPAGGGVRNASGRFFGRSTLPLIATSPRPTQDWDRDPFHVGRHDRATSYTDSLPRGPVDRAASRDYQSDDTWGMGRPARAPSAYSFYQGRYGVLNADPLFRLGWDLRMATLLSGTALFFPMQADLQAAVHPVEHVTAVAAVGARGRSRGFGETADSPGSPYLRTGYLLLSEAPWQAYVKAGRFVPSYGLRLDNHTAFIRRGLHLDDGIPESRVTGIELGAAPNYPFLTASLFRMKAEGVAPEAFDIFDVDDGHGWAINAGFREMGWGGGASYLGRRRPLSEGGDETALGGYVYWNPWKAHRSLPLTWQAEFDHLSGKRAGGTSVTGLYFYQEADYLLGNGFNLLATQEWEDPDRDVMDDEAFRIGAGFQLTPIPGMTLDTRGRVLFPAGGAAGADFFLQLHFWN